jgi:hypothetical protein
MNCRACDAPIEFVTTESGNKMPVDAVRVLVVEEPGAKLRMVLDDGRVVAARLVRDGEAGVSARASHFSTCPEADKFRRKRRASAS